MNTVIPYYWFDTSRVPHEVTKIREHESDAGKGRKIRCRGCEQIITDDAQRISVAGGHSHYRVNPSGIEFHFQCFNQAPGCSALGPATYEHTWFTGYRWQIAICNRCGEHLGWLYRGSSSFYGLISNKLICDVDDTG
jgi:hypothetical protein